MKLSNLSNVYIKNLLNHVVAVPKFLLRISHILVFNQMKEYAANFYILAHVHMSLCTWPSCWFQRRLAQQC